MVAGCLVERFHDEIRKNIPEVDAVVGTGELEKILAAAGVAETTRAPGPFNILSSTTLTLAARGRSSPRARSFRARFLGRRRRRPAQLPLRRPHAPPPDHAGSSAYIKIAEGCDHPCSFCIIPQLRGQFRSRRFESVVAEAERLAQSGVREITLIGQDTTCYGEDLGLKDGLAAAAGKTRGRRRPAVDSLPLRLSQQNHGPTAGDDRSPRQYLFVHRRAPAARIGNGSEAHETWRRSATCSCARSRKCAV